MRITILIFLTLALEVLLAARSGRDLVAARTRTSATPSGGLARTVKGREKGSDRDRDGQARRASPEFR